MTDSFGRSQIQRLSLNELLSFKTLKAMHRAEREGYPDELSLRMHRALSWLGRSEREPNDSDCRFLLLWIAFNAAYAQEFVGREGFGERRLFIRFLRRLIDADEMNLIYDAVWHSYSDSLRVFLDNQYVFQPFWDYQTGRIDQQEWQDRIAHSKEVARRSLSQQNTSKILVILFDRLYTLRNQLMHGGATWNSGVNRDQVDEGARILGLLVPLMIFLMMYKPEKDWGVPCYPVLS